MSKLNVRIEWSLSTETLFFDTDELLAPGQQITTFERWADFEDPTEYNVKVVKHTAKNGIHNIHLSYDQENNTGQALENVAWGISEITVDVVSNKAKAKWRNNPSSEEWDGPAPASVYAEDLYEDLGYAYERRKIRKQDAFRRKLLEINRQCALSGDQTIAALEAAHIIDVEGDGGFVEGNGILLRADIHKLFDRGIIEIASDGSAILKNKKNVSTYYTSQVKNWKLDPEVLRRIKPALELRRNAKTAA